MPSLLFKTISPYRLFLWALLISATILSSSIFGWLSSLDYELASVRGDGIVNLELAWNSKIAEEIVQAWDQGGLVPTAKKSIHWDFLFILAYLATLLSGLALAWRKLTSFSGQPHFILYAAATMPIAAALFDVIENLLMLWTLSDIGDVGAIRPMLTTGFAYTKFALLTLFIILVLYFSRPALKTVIRVRFSILMLVICVALLFVPQWQEILRAIMEANEDEGINRQALLLACASLIAAISTWYSARVQFMFCLEPKGNRSDTASGKNDCSHDPMSNLKRWLPRVTGSLVIVVVALGFFISAPFGHIGAAIEPVAYQLAALILFLITVLLRRKILGFPSDSPMTNIADGFAGLSRKTRLPLYVLAVGNILCFLFFLFFPYYAVYVGAAAVAIFAIALIVPWGSLLAHFGTKIHFPLLTIVVVLAVLFSLTNDNHSIRLCEKMGSIERECADTAGKVNAEKQSKSDGMKKRTAFEAFMDEWIDERHKNKNEKIELPVFIVSAEGGGIRAAFWTAHVLATLQDHACDQGLDFRRHLLAISGVSGGSLGGAVFAASAKHIGNNCKESPKGYKGYSELAHDVLGSDFLSPTVATLLFPDLLQWFIPIPLFDDRAITMERSWERAWRKKTGKGDFTAPFDTLWHTPQSDKAEALDDKQEKLKPPVLLLNSTVVETGQRLIMNPLLLEASDLEFDGVFRDAINGYSLLGDKVPLSTAVHLSARFTYVSPAGKVFSSGTSVREPSWFRLVDGGYFENSGAVTATELLDAVEKYQPHSSRVHLKPFVIHISNEPVIPDYERARKQISFYPIMGEVLSPLRALLHVRPARGFQAREYLQMRLEDDDSNIVRHVHFLLCKCDLDLPLGWMLSKAVQENIISQFPLINKSEELPAEDGEDMLTPNREKLEQVLQRTLGWAQSDEALKKLSYKFMPIANKEASKRYNLKNMELVLQHLRKGEATGKPSSDRESALIQSCRQSKPTRMK